MRGLALLPLIALAGCLKVLNHDEDAAARQALEFAKVALLAHNDQAAYPTLAEEARKGISLEKYSAVVKEMHPSGFPKTITATQYEPIPSQAAMSIILVGQNGTEEFHYRLVMLGTADSGYAVGGFFRGKGPYEGSPMIKGAKMLQALKSPYSASST